VVAVGAAADAGIAQMLLPCRCAGCELAEVIERLMMDLEIRTSGNAWWSPSPWPSSASCQPPAYQAQSTFASDSTSPMVR